MTLDCLRWIVSFTEIKKKVKESENLDEYMHLYKSVDKTNKARAGVSILIKNIPARNIRDCDAHIEHLLKVDLKLEGVRSVNHGSVRPFQQP